MLQFAVSQALGLHNKQSGHTTSLEIEGETETASGRAY